MIYLALKHLHVTFVALSGLGFLARGLLMVTDSPYLAKRWLRIAPHIVDTLLLASALGIVFMTAQYPLAQHWLTAKVIGLVIYIFCGTMALKRGKTKTVRIAFFIAALAVFAYIVGVALTRNPYLA